MNFPETIAPFAPTVLSYHLVHSLLESYERPNDKISELLKANYLISLKKGLYIIGEKVQLSTPEPFLIANHLSGPSYVSLDAALSYHGLTPERVFTITSITTKAPRIYTNAIGRFEYIRQRPPYYSLGIDNAQLSDNQSIMLATPEKALFDKIVTTSGLQFQSKKSAFEYVTENLRIDEQKLAELDLEKMKSWLEVSPKKKSLSLLIKSIEKL